MNKEEIDDWLRYFSNNNQCFMSKDGKIITLFKVFQELEQLQQENKELKERIDKAIKYINDNLIISSILDGKKYYTINDYNFDYKELLDILKEVE